MIQSVSFHLFCVCGVSSSIRVGVLILLVSIVWLHHGVAETLRRRLLLHVQVSETCPVFRCQILGILHIVSHPLERPVDCVDLTRCRQIRLRILPVTVDVAVQGFREELVEVWLGQDLLLYGDEIVVKLVNITDASGLHEGDVLVLVVHVLDELTVGDVVFWLLLVFQWLTWEHVEAVDLLLGTLGLFHAYLVDLSAESLALFGEHLVEISRQKDLTVVSVTQLVDTKSDLSVRGKVKGINFELRADCAFNSSADMQGKRDADDILVLESLLDARVSGVSHQVLGSLQLCKGLDCRDKSAINHFFTFFEDLSSSQRLALLIFITFAIFYLRIAFTALTIANFSISPGAIREQ